MRQLRLRVCVVATVWTVLIGGRPAAAQDNVALRWNEALLQGVRNTRFAPMFAARALAVVHTAMYDAWAAYDETAVGTRLGGTLRRPPVERTLANRDKAVRGYRPGACPPRSR